MKYLVLYSGGLDSTTLLYHTKNHFQCEWSDIIGLNMYYGQKHSIETTYACALAGELGFKYVTCNLAPIFTFGHKCTMLDNGTELPLGTYEEQLKETAIVSTYVPFRNGLFLSVAASLAIQLGADIILYGAHKGDATASYPDCTADFFNYMAKAIYEGSGNQVSVSAPFIEYNKAEIVKEGLRLNVPFEKTWSCYQGGNADKELITIGGCIPCGKCATCLDREEAFKRNGYKETVEGLQRIL